MKLLRLLPMPRLAMLLLSLVVAGNVPHQPSPMSFRPVGCGHTALTIFHLRVPENKNCPASAQVTEFYQPFRGGGTAGA